jgi:hypothetical protein
LSTYSFQPIAIVMVWHGDLRVMCVPTSRTIDQTWSSKRCRKPKWSLSRRLAAHTVDCHSALSLMPATASVVSLLVRGAMVGSSHSATAHDVCGSRSIHA